ncbi:hypothetical protein [Arthrobacter sp. ZGTC412]|uniref:hypothetical protein n=1 Tax=Arthrobacter sp. ZGTC412 TaxID=2058900 RepID=UPI000CE386E2|nr:hypothetical protein [Arthrobacter sp. ZGTC412]
MPLSPDSAEKRVQLETLPQQLPGRGVQAAVREDALQQAPGRPVLMLRPARVKMGSIIGLAIAYTVTHVLVEWDDGGGQDTRWVASWLVRRL